MIEGAVVRVYPSFVLVDVGLTLVKGFLPLADLGWDEEPVPPAVGAPVRVAVVGRDPQKRSVQLNARILTPDP